jgi:hypothetical protein
VGPHTRLVGKPLKKMELATFNARVETVIVL